MPNLWSLRRVLLVWHFRARAFRCCARRIFAAVRSRRFLGGVWPSHQDGMQAAIASCTWHSVSSGFFPPELLPHPCQEQVADRTERQVTLQAHVPPPLVVIQPDLAFLVLEAAFHAPAREPDQQQLPDRGPRRGVTDWSFAKWPDAAKTKTPDRHFGDQNARQNLGASRVSRSCHDVAVTTTECRFLGKCRKTRGSA